MHINPNISSSSFTSLNHLPSDVSSQVISLVNYSFFNLHIALHSINHSGQENAIKLALSRHKITIGLPSGFTNLASLKTFLKKFGASVKNLDLSFYSKLSVNDLKQILSYTPNLESLNLSEYKYLINNDFAYFPSSLQSLQIYMGKTLTTLESAPSQLKELKIHGLATSIDFSKFPQLLSLDISELSDLSSLGLSQYNFQNLSSSLEYLSVSSTINFSNELLKTLPRTLKHLDLSFGSIGDFSDTDDFNFADSFPFLETLDVSYCKNLTSKDLAKLPSTLKHLNLFESTSIKDDGLLTLPQNLIKISLRECLSITDTGISYLPQSLKRVDLSFNSNISARGLLALPPALTHLELNHCTFSTDVPLQPPSSLTHLELNDSAISDSNIQNLPSSLTLLELTNSNISINGLKSLPSSLTELRLNDCHSIYPQTWNSLGFQIKWDSMWPKISWKQALEEIDWNSLFPLLIHLNLSNCNLYDRHIQTLPKGLKVLDLS